MSLCQQPSLGFCRCCCVCVTVYACVLLVCHCLLCVCHCVLCHSLYFVAVSVFKNMFAYHCVLLSVTLCAYHCVCYSVSLSLGSLSLFMSLTLWVCLYLSLCVTVSVLCVTIYPGVTVLLTTQATGGRVGPTGARAGAQPIPPSPAMGACLWCLPQVNTKIRNPRATSLTSALVPQPALDWAAPESTGSAPKLEMCPDLPPASPSPSLGPALSVCLCLSGCLLLCVCVGG